GWSGSPSITTGVTEKYNTTLGMSIVKYTGNGIAGATIPHSLGSKPFMVIVKKLNSATNSIWAVYHEAVGATKYCQLHLTEQFHTSTTIWNDTEPTSELVTLGGNANINNNGDSYIAYIFCETDFCKLIEYTGSGSTDGPFVNLGISPEFLVLKNADTGTTNWLMYDGERGAYNPDDSYLVANASSTEGSGYYHIDKVANGVKVRYAAAFNDINQSGKTFVGLAIGRPTQATKGS
ncbi:MAG: hypothetical protein OQK35_01760, partial [Alphaproteobacteria bacterium]|nr:hypothetical protein [Alphaproteobacteria bacterium]